MAIVLILIAIAAAIAVTAVAILVGALITGWLLSRTRRGRVFGPIFFIIIPAMVVGSIAGAVIVGYFAVHANENLIVLGPLGGLGIGGLVGLSFGLAGALFWWRRNSRLAAGRTRSEGSNFL